MKWPRASGILVHPTALPGRFGVGDLGRPTIDLLDFLVSCRQKLWQVLPLCPTGYGNSPYAGLSAFAGNPVLIAPERLVDDGLLSDDDLRMVPDFPQDRVDYGQVMPWKMTLFRVAHARLRAVSDLGHLHEAYAAFCSANSTWLEDYALFAALKDAHGGVAWVEWEAPLARREPDALDAARGTHADDIELQRFVQFLFFRQWAAVRAAARARDISIIGDVAIFVAHDSADVWAHPELFQLDEQGQPVVVAGVPPDYFSPTGQRWGNPLYRWDVLAQTGYAWWIERIRRALELEDIVRLDHFRGFHSYWEVPGTALTASDGKWQPGPRDALFSAILSALGDVPFIAEDLGQITPGVTRLRERLQFPGMRVLQFGFGGNAKNPHLPHNFSRDSVVYTGTHDNDTTRGWFEERSGGERAHALRYLDATDADVTWQMIRAALASVANLALMPLQDVLDIGSSARMNFPSRADGNWEWRCTKEQLTPAIAKRLATLTTLYGR